MLEINVYFSPCAFLNDKEFRRILCFILVISFIKADPKVFWSYLLKKFMDDILNILLSVITCSVDIWYSVKNINSQLQKNKNAPKFPISYLPIVYEGI